MNSKMCIRPLDNPEEQLTCQARLDRLEGDLQHRLRCLDEHGGMNLRDKNHLTVASKMCVGACTHIIFFNKLSPACFYQTKS